MGGSGSKEPSGTAMAAGVIIVLVICAVGMVARWMGDSSNSNGRKTMKAPGSDRRIFRDEFAKDPSAYFRDLRKKSLTTK
ncbi:hypothetical protein BT93_E0161 [Corymbia citriodora subsp. variegata]|nr:hypothetical protein BT93_E0161 [Corymbia citriodora subsp. variegata]